MFYAVPCQADPRYLSEALEFDFDTPEALQAETS